jgi:CRP/FNR family transcriptional regulator, cyclic AMP receptor protein
MPRHTCPSTNRVAPAGYATVNFRGWKASIVAFGKWQKKPSEHNLHERQLSRECQQAYHKLRSFVVTSAPERITRLMLEWSHDDFKVATAKGIEVALTHDEIGQIIGMSRETVTRTLANFRKQRIAELHGSTLMIQNMSAIQRLADV